MRIITWMRRRKDPNDLIEDRYIYIMSYFRVPFFTIWSVQVLHLNRVCLYYRAGGEKATQCTYTHTIRVLKLRLHPHIRYCYCSIPTITFALFMHTKSLLAHDHPSSKGLRFFSLSLSPRIKW